MKNKLQYCLSIAVMLWFLPLSIATAQAVSLEQLQKRMLENSPLSGYFFKCTQQGSAKISESGSFFFDPKSHIKLNFDSPYSYSLSFFSDGTQLKTSRNLKKSVQTHNRVGHLIFSIVKLQESSLERYFEIILNGTAEEFHMSLIPQKRMSKIINSLDVNGSLGMVSKIRMATQDNRVITMQLFSKKKTGELTCE